MATLRLHLGEPARARELWRKATTRSRGQAFEMRESARPTWSKATSTPPAAIYQQALDANPSLFEAHYCLAVLEQDAGHAPPAYEQAHMALEAARDDSARSAARAIAAGVARFARDVQCPRTSPEHAVVCTATRRVQADGGDLARRLRAGGLPVFVAGISALRR